MEVINTFAEDEEMPKQEKSERLMASNLIDHRIVVGDCRYRVTFLLIYV